MDIVIHPLNEELLFTTRTYSDDVAGELIEKTPVNFDGHTVLSRPRVYIGRTQIQTTGGRIGVQFNIKADSLREAFQLWPDLAKAACKKCIEDMQSAAVRQAILAPGKKNS